MSRSIANYQPSHLGDGAADSFWVITAYFNPCRYESRLKNYLEFARRLRKQNVQLLTVELAQHESEAHLDDRVCTRYVRVVEDSVLWAKERLLNIGIGHLPDACTEICWADCDVCFENDRWAATASRMLKRHRVLQPFATSYFLVPGETPENHQRYEAVPSFARTYVQRHGASMAFEPNALQPNLGYAWAARRDVIERIHGLYDRSILGHGDIVMALAFTHSLSRDGPFPDTWENWSPGWSDALRRDAIGWQKRAAEVVDGDLSFVDGAVMHLWHGPGRNRQYTTRGSLLRDFDPDRHIRLAESQMWQWTAAAIQIRLPERVKQYFERRKEDTK